MTNTKLAAELRRLGRIDQTRRKIFRPGDTWDDAADRTNTARLKIIVRAHGWPTITKVGRAASRAAWLIVQHAAFDKSFQRRALHLMQAAHRKKAKDVPLYQIAYLTDRLLVESGRPQLFGTQFKISRAGLVRPAPIKDKTKLDERRTMFGLEPFAKYLRSANQGLKSKYKR